MHQLHLRTLDGSEYGMKNLNTALNDYRLILIYACCLAVFIPFLWFFCPETKGTSLEEIGVIFGDRHVRTTLMEGLSNDIGSEEVQHHEKGVVGHAERAI